MLGFTPKHVAVDVKKLKIFLPQALKSMLEYKASLITVSQVG
jgi:hypothetical protein